MQIIQRWQTLSIGRKAAIAFGAPMTALLVSLFLFYLLFAADQRRMIDHYLNALTLDSAAQDLQIQAEQAAHEMTRWLETHATPWMLLSHRSLPQTAVDRVNEMVVTHQQLETRAQETLLDAELMDSIALLQPFLSDGTEEREGQDDTHLLAAAMEIDALRRRLEEEITRTERLLTELEASLAQPDRETLYIELLWLRNRVLRQQMTLETHTRLLDALANLRADVAGSPALPEADRTPILAAVDSLEETLVAIMDGTVFLAQRTLDFREDLETLAGLTAAVGAATETEIQAARSALVRQEDEQIRVVAGAMVLTLLAAWAMTRVLGIGVRERVAPLLQAVERFGVGDRTARAPVHGNDELTRLAAGFNNMAAEMNTLVQDLEATVEERTAALSTANQQLQAEVEERTRIEEALRDERRMLAGLMGSLPGMAYRCRLDKEWTMEFVSQGCVELTGYRPDELCGNATVAYAHLIHPDDRAAVYASVQRAVACRENFQLTYRLRDRQGVEKWVWEQGGVVDGEPASPQHLVGFITDISSQMEAQLALHENEARHRAVINAIPDILLILSHDGKILDIRPGDADSPLPAFIAEAAAGQSLVDLLPQETQRRFFTMLGHLVERGGVQIMEFSLEEDEMRHSWEMRLTRGAREQVLVILRDMSHERAVQERLRRSEERYRAIFENTGTATVLISNNMTLLLVNDEFTKLTGAAKHQVEGKKKWIEFVLPADRQRMRRFHELQRADVREQAPDRYEFRLLRTDGALRHIQAHVDMIPGADISVASLLDITERKEAEEALRALNTSLERQVADRTAEFQAEKERSETILYSVGDAICTTTTDRHIDYVNDAFVRMTGYVAPDLLGRPLSILWAGAPTNPERQALERAAEQGESWHGDLTVRRQDGRFYEAAVTLVPLLDEREAVTGLVCSHQDISRRKDLDRARSQFITNVSHHLRTPVSNIKYYVQLVKRHLESERAPQYLDVLERQSQLLEHLIQDILVMTELDSGRNVTAWQNIRVDSLIEDALLLHSHEAEERRITLSREKPPAELPPLHGDQVRLTHALGELLINAITFTQIGGQVSVTVAPRVAGGEQWLCIAVRDNGPGIALAEQEQIFERFYRGSMADGGNIPGSGLGLNMAQEIARGHGGRISVESRESAGSTFTLWLPTEQTGGPDGRPPAMD